MLEALAKWWNALELWLAQLWFPFQIALVMLVLLPLAWAVVSLVDRAVDRAGAAISRSRSTAAAPPVDLPHRPESIGSDQQGLQRGSLDHREPAPPAGAQDGVA